MNGSDEQTGGGAQGFAPLRMIDPAARRATYRRWALEETDPRYRVEFYRLSLTRRRRLALTLRAAWPGITLVAVLSAAAIVLGVWA